MAAAPSCCCCCCAVGSRGGGGGGAGDVRVQRQPRAVDETDSVHLPKHAVVQLGPSRRVVDGSHKLPGHAPSGSGGGGGVAVVGRAPAPQTRKNLLVPAQIKSQSTDTKRCQEITHARSRRSLAVLGQIHCRAAQHEHTQQRALLQRRWSRTSWGGAKRGSRGLRPWPASARGCLAHRPRFSIPFTCAKSCSSLRPLQR